MPADVLLGSFQNHIKTFKKFELLTRAQKPTFTKDYEYVDYALSMLQRSFATPLEAFPNDLEGCSTGLIKSTFDAEDLRNMGNAVFKIGHFFEARNLYTLSIAYAKSGSIELALAYGNRSAVLFEKQYYKECLEDIQRAFESNYPPKKKDKLLKRQTKAKELLPTQKKVLYHGNTPTMKSRNVAMPSASECIQINKDEEFGRHIVANRTINPGEMLLVEKPYSQIVFPENRTLHCSECLKTCYNMIPCEKCSGVLYCSTTCRRKAYVDYHRYECAVLSHFGYDIINWNATRLTLKGIKEYDTEDTDPNVYRSDRYKEFSELISHKSTCGSNRQMILIFRAAGAAKVFYALKKYTDIFAAFDVEDKENVLKTLLFNDTFIDQFNGFRVTKYHIDIYINFGRAIYSTLSMFNHACNENVGLSFYGSSVVLRAKKKIKKGEQCFINYGVNPFTESRRKRQEFFQHNYNFICKCQACIQNWPKGEELGSKARCLIPYFAGIYAEVAFTYDMDQHRKRTLLQKTFRIIEQIEKEAPFLTYAYSRDILNRILLEGNMHIPF